MPAVSTRLRRRREGGEGKEEGRRHLAGSIGVAEGEDDACKDGALVRGCGDVLGVRNHVRYGGAGVGGGQEGVTLTEVTMYPNVMHMTVMRLAKKASSLRKPET